MHREIIVGHLLSTTLFVLHSSSARALLAIAGVLATYYFFFKNPNEFKNHGIPYVRPLPLVSNMGQLISGQKTAPEFFKLIYGEYFEAKYVGMYNFFMPVIMLRDPQLIKSVAIIQFDMFTDHRVYGQNGRRSARNSHFVLSSWRQVAADEVYSISGLHV
ncbi:Cytochrome P450 9e2 [Harpegnathos saltator]|uniref:Cytochrome P450 9e2 n=1 Tax=Harpegnathos saltator TaxID=610380 RepID=E2B5J7_HARSA|nr:Cytochrome P450 9e2 [Harpegnathos saltator]EFN89041.1 Cytochrome P450 9e2 [Harpegnathos saltator]